MSNLLAPPTVGHMFATECKRSLSVLKNKSVIKLLLVLLPVGFHLTDPMLGVANFPGLLNRDRLFSFRYFLLCSMVLVPEKKSFLFLYTWPCISKSPHAPII